MAYFLKSGTTFKVSSKEQMDLYENLPAGNYTIKVAPGVGFYLDQIEDFVMPPKIYGDVSKNTNRIISTFKDRKGSTGILLCGEKGSGKSLLAKNIAIEGAKIGIPTLTINSAFCGDAFNSFMQLIDQPCIILLDEYDKVYNAEEQQQLLTLLDGVFPSKKLFVLTVNNKWSIDQHMKNRPGRIYYIIDYDGIDEQFIREFCQDNLKNQSEIDRVVQVAHTFDKFNFDMLKAVVEEMNRYGESVVDVIRLLNVKAEFASHVNYEITISVNGIRIDLDSYNNSVLTNPLSKHFVVDFPIGKDQDGDVIEQVIEVTPNDLKSIEQGGQRYIFEKSGAVITLTKAKPVTYNYLDRM